MYLEVLTSKAQKLWPLIKEFPSFVLGGGTALALQIGRRVSLDFDLFSKISLSEELLDRVEEIFQAYKKRFSISTSDQLTVSIRGVQVSFLHDPFPAVTRGTKVDGMTVFSISELAAMKAYALGRRDKAISKRQSKSPRGRPFRNGVSRSLPQYFCSDTQ